MSQEGKKPAAAIAEDLEELVCGSWRGYPLYKSPHRPEFTTINPEEMRKHLSSYNPMPQQMKKPLLFNSSGDVISAPEDEPEEETEE